MQKKFLKLFESIPIDFELHEFILTILEQSLQKSYLIRVGIEILSVLDNFVIS